MQAKLTTTERLNPVSHGQKATPKTQGAATEYPVRQAVVFRLG